MASERKIFRLSGPYYLTNVDWFDPDHRRCIAASLVQGVYAQERERQDRRLGADGHVELWWSFYRIKNEKIKRGFHIARSLVTAGLSMTLQDNRTRAKSQRTFSVLQWCVPCLYVNRQDVVSLGYVGYFANREVMQQMRAGGIAKLAARHSISEIVLSAFGKKSEAGHLIPCASLIINLNVAPDFKMAHSIQQWWAADIRIECTEYRPAGTLEKQPNTALHLRPHI